MSLRIDRSEVFAEHSRRVAITRILSILHSFLNSGKTELAFGGFTTLLT
ncbi:MAG TPA: hypothetical protein IGS40_27915 [Trichormus sp. M33_DOE_039]|nr:hypothetical protein [Trichormus sp. M33_DOE_039]